MSWNVLASESMDLVIDWRYLWLTLFWPTKGEWLDQKAHCVRVRDFEKLHRTLYVIDMSKVNRIMTIYMYNIHKKFAHCNSVVVKIIWIFTCVHISFISKERIILCKKRVRFMKYPLYDCPLYKNLLMKNSSGNYPYSV